MATQHPSSALRRPAPSPPYPKANPGYGKRSARDQRPPREDDFRLLPERERHVAGYLDHLPDGAAMDIKSLAKCLPLYGQMAVGSALRALGVAGHLRHVRCLAGVGDGQLRWVTLTFWSRTARDNEWWSAYLDAAQADAGAGTSTGTATGTKAAAHSGPASVPRQRTARSTAPASERAPEPAEDPGSGQAAAPAPAAAPTDAAAAMPRPVRSPEAIQAAATGPDSLTVSAPEVRAGYQTEPSAAYVALAQLGRTEPRLALSAADCSALEGQAAAWFARGVDAAYLTHALTSGLPARVDSPVGLLRRRLHDKIPPQLPAAAATPAQEPPVRRLMVECTDCGAPGRPEALPDGLCRNCRTAPPAEPVEAPPVVRDVAAHVGALRELMRLP
ncbi:MarR family transcriptional regulator [Streptomyces sp. NPDC006288]|uniref:MarR family transcriptional regulator n=1 Tax=Streptomyces sp. NPDC006288 TaxID=3156743 RepID=UPI0033B72725